MKKVIFLIGFFVVVVTAAQNFASGNLLKYIRFCLFLAVRISKREQRLKQMFFKLLYKQK
jgi:hypothetical protein